jgi:hypothetical protein
MTVKDLFIALCFLGSVALASIGGWNYMWGRIDLFNENLKADQLRDKGITDYNPETQLEKIRKEKTNALIMFAAGAAGVYIIVAHIYRRKRNFTRIKNHPTKENQL